MQSSDIDGRLKTLFDALKMPKHNDELGDFKSGPPGLDEDPFFFVLFEDDKLITRVAVEADTLYQPVSDPPNINDARVIISVKIRPWPLTDRNFGFG